MSVERVADALDFIDQYMAAASTKSAQQGNKVTCSAGCFHCCKEPVYAERLEVEYMLQTLSVESRARATVAAQTWWDGFYSAGLDRDPVPKKGGGFAHLLKFRAEKLWCPLLKDGLCAAYERRPTACRIHAAIRTPLLCERDELREKQKYMFTAQQDEVEMEALRRIYGDVSQFLVQIDHLGIWLGHLLLGKTERSEAGHDILATVKNAP